MKKDASRKETNDKLFTNFANKFNLDATYEVHNYHPIFSFDCLHFLFFFLKKLIDQKNPKQGGFAADGSEELLGKHGVAWGWGGLSPSVSHLLLRVVDPKSYGLVFCVILLRVVLHDFVYIMIMFE